MDFKIQSKYKPAGDQPKAIESLVSNINSGVKDQVLLGVTGSGKTFTIANLIEKTNKPTLVIAHNKTLAAQLTQEFREFFPENEVEYFVSYYDYYQPEAYLSNTDTYIEKEATVNDEIDRLRNAATQAILTRNDVIVVASVSCIYGLGSPDFYSSITLNLKVGDQTSREELMRKLISLRYAREDIEPKRGTFRARGSLLELIPANKEIIYQIEISDKIERIKVIHKINRNELEEVDELLIFPFGHYVWPEDLRNKALIQIEQDLESQLKVFRKAGKILEAERLSRRTRYDMEMIKEIGYCNGIENYSRYFDERLPGQPPYTLIDYFEKSYGKDYLMVIDESHVTVPQIGGMYMGDLSRKDSLVDYGFRLPAAKDNRPLKFNEFEAKMPQTIYVSATPSKYELEKSKKTIVEQIVRPTGLIDPDVEIRKTKGQIDDLLAMIEGRTKAGERTLVTSLTKRMAEDLATYLEERSVKVRYLHSDIDTLERIQILTDLRRGEFDVLIGVNLLREGLDLPEVSLVAILDADKEGFLRSEMSLIQTIGRAARNVNGKVILYADRITGSMKRAIDETTRRRKIQLKYNEENGITPKTIEKEIRSIYENIKTPEFDLVEEDLSKVDLKALIKRKETDMKQASAELRFEEAAIIRDQLIELKKAAGFFSKAR
jgi:excinuclease ABC subunit B